MFRYFLTGQKRPKLLGAERIWHGWYNQEVKSFGTRKRTVSAPNSALCK